MKYNHLFLCSVRSCLVGILLCFFCVTAVACQKAEPLDETSSTSELITSSDLSTTTVPSTTPEPSTTTDSSIVPETPITEDPEIPATTVPDTPPTPPVTEDEPDVTPPTVSGQDFEVEQGSSVSYKKHITVSDDRDGAPTIKIDNSAVDLDTPGVYPVTYKVTDDAGNTATLTLNLTVKKKINAGATEEYVLSEAQKILDEITDDSMSDLQVAYTIYRWTKYNIGYSDTSDKTNWLVGAYDGFRTRRGDCYTYFAVSKALLTAAGIDNVDMIKHRTSEKASRHYWSLVNVGDGWYHFDSTPYVYKESNFFMLTDAEISKWDNKYYKNAHAFLEEGLPERSDKSIQDRVNYSSANLKY